MKEWVDIMNVKTFWVLKTSCSIRSWIRDLKFNQEVQAGEMGFPGSTIRKEPACNEGDNEMWLWSPGWEDSREEGLETHFSILAWRIPWMEEPGGLQSIGSQKVRHNWNDLAYMHRPEKYVWSQWYMHKKEVIFSRKVHRVEKLGWI